VWLITITVVSLVAVGIATSKPWLGWTLVVIFALLYFAVADWLYIARLAAYVAIAEADAAPAIAPPPPAAPLAPAELAPAVPTDAPFGS
jgi:hypothetical protein